MGALLLLGVAASVYLVYVLEILKFRRVRAWQLRRADPDTTEHDIDEQVERETRDRRVLSSRFEPDSGVSRTGSAHRTGWYGSPRPNDPRRFPEEVSRTLKTNACISMRGLVPSPAAFRRASVLLAP